MLLEIRSIKDGNTVGLKVSEDPENGY